MTRPIYEGLQRLPNGEIFDQAIAESRIIVTFDLDFGEIVALAKGEQGWSHPISSAQYSNLFCNSAPLRGDFRMRGRFDERRYCDCRRNQASGERVSIDRTRHRSES